jgi:hypothetical protein
VPSGLENSLLGCSARWLGLLKLRLCGFKILLRYVDLKFQRVQLWILKNRPPITAKILIIGLGGLPVPYHFIGRRSGRCRKGDTLGQPRIPSTRALPTQAQSARELAAGFRQKQILQTPSLDVPGQGCLNNLHSLSEDN